jgi:pimeloyl-ACP methyl ester carboxylesterase
LLDTFDLARAHLVGMSMGGAIVQLAALHHPDRVASLTLISAGPSAPGPDDPDLPEMSQETVALFTVDEPDWADRSAVIDYGVHLARVSSSRSRPFDEANIRELWGRVLDRTANVASTMTNHNVIDHGDRWRERLGEVRAPTLVVHGTEDPVVPYGNALALAKELPDTRLIALEGSGHELPRRDWDVVVLAILEHTSRRRSR